MYKFIKIFKKVNGIKVLQQYRKARVLCFALFQTALLGVSQKSLEIVRLSVDNRILSKLRKEYKYYIKEYLNINNENISKMPKERSRKVWICWLQGMENAPELVKCCYESIKNNLVDREVIIITEDNYKDYIVFPEHIQRKYDDGVITKTHFSDLLRLELLIRYGGTWIDSTVLCTSSEIKEYILDSDLFLYQCLKPGRDGHCTVISSWLITACTNNPILLLTRELLYKYWEKYNYMKDYFLLHKFFQLAIEAYPEEWKKVIPFSNSIPHILLLNLFEEYDERWLKNVKNMTEFHKLSYKFSKHDMEKEKTFYKKLIDRKI